MTIKLQFIVIDWSPYYSASHVCVFEVTPLSAKNCRCLTATSVVEVVRLSTKNDRCLIARAVSKATLVPLRYSLNYLRQASSALLHTCMCAAFSAWREKKVLSPSKHYILSAVALLPPK